MPMRLVVGAGPAGLAAALAAGRAGARVILVDEQQEMGGSLLSDRQAMIDGKPAAEWVADALAELRAMPDVTLLPRTVAFGYYDHNMVSLMERVTDHLNPTSPEALSQPRQRLWRVRAKDVILATGAIERPLVYLDNDRPDCMLASAAQTYVNRYGSAPGKRAVVLTNNDTAYQVALDLVDAGVSVAAIVDVRDNPDGELVANARSRGIEILADHAITRVKGKLAVSEVEVRRLTSDGKSVTSDGRSISCDLVLQLRRLAADRAPVLAVARQGEMEPGHPGVRARQAAARPEQPIGRRGPRQVRAGGLPGRRPRRRRGLRARCRLHRSPPAARRLRAPSRRLGADARDVGRALDQAARPRGQALHRLPERRDRRRRGCWRIAKAIARSSISSATPPWAWRPTRARPATSTRWP